MDCIEVLRTMMNTTVVNVNRREGDRGGSLVHLSDSNRI